MNSMLTNHLRATYDVAVKCVETDVMNLRMCKLVNELADPEFTAVYAENTALREISVTHGILDQLCPLNGLATEELRVPLLCSECTPMRSLS